MNDNKKIDEDFIAKTTLKFFDDMAQQLVSNIEMLAITSTIITSIFVHSPTPQKTIDIFFKNLKNEIKRQRQTLKKMKRNSG